MKLAALVLLAALAPARAEKLETSLDDGQVRAAFEKVLDDPFFERFTGLKILDRAPMSGGRYAGGTRSFRFVKACVERSVHEKPVEEKTTHSWGYQVKKYTERTTTTKRTRQTLVISYLPTVELPSKRDASGKGKIKLYCGYGEFGKEEKGGVNLFTALGGLAGAISKGISMGVSGEKEWSAGGGCTWEPFNPGGFADWVGDKWLPWRFSQFAGGEDAVAAAFKLFSQKKYAEALPYFQGFADHFGFGKRKNQDSDKDVFPFEYHTSMPELFAILGDIHRLGFGDMEQAEKNYLIGSSIAGAPYLAETAGVARANRGLGLVLAERARKAKDDPRKAAILGAKASFFLYAYLGFYKDREAPEHAEIMATIKEVDPGEIEGRQQEALAEEKGRQQMEERKQQKEKVKALMEY